MRGSKAVLIAAAVVLGAAGPSTVQYTYDAAGRVTTAVNTATGLCTTFSYDANGNRTAQATTSGGAPVTSTWGTGVWGCALWSQ